MNANETSTVVMQVPPFCLNRQAAIAFSSFKPSYFDEKVRPLLTELRAGTSVLYLREEVETVIRNMFLDKGASEQLPAQPGADANKASEKKWEKRQVASTRTPVAAGRSTSTSTGYDFTSALQALKTRRAG